MSEQIENINSEGGNCKDIISLTSKMINCPTVLTGMSHEVRTHMNAIVAFSFLMNRNSCDEAEREEFTSHILTSCEQLIGLFDNFIDSAIIDTGNSKADLKVCKLNSLLDELFTEFREILQKDEHKEVTLINESSHSENIEVLIDSNRVFRVIRNLFQNALNNTMTGYIKVGYCLINGILTFSVLDSGQGFFKCNEFLHTEDLNASLGRYNDTSSAINLTLAKKIIQMLGGSISIECNGLTGCGIYFSLPVKVINSSDLSINKYVNTMIAI